MTESDFPPTTRCTLCGQSDCEGCLPKAAILSAPSVAPLSPLWAAAVHSVTQVETWVPAVETQNTLKTLRFALLAETGAAFSFYPAIALLLAVLSRSPLRLGEHAWGTLGWALSLSAGLALLMLALRILWALSLELHAALAGGGGFRPRGALCFALYSCGWDLVTSPLGLLLSMRRSGARRGLRQVELAAYVPKVALKSYLTQVRGFTERRARWLAFSSFVVPIIGLFLLLAAALWLWIMSLLP